MASLDPTTLVCFNNAASGHEGVLSDANGDLIIKPCTQQEIDFYQSALDEHPAFARYMPTFMGSLALNSNPQDPSSATPSAAAGAPKQNVETAATLQPDTPRLPQGRRLKTEISIVLANIAAGFKKPNIMDVKLGSRLWDEAAPLEKRQRFDRMAAESTSGPLGFRVTGMRVWQGAAMAVGAELGLEGKSKEAGEVVGEGADADAGGLLKFTKLEEGGYRRYDKFWGRQFTEENVVDAIRSYTLVPSANVTAQKAKMVAKLMLAHARAIQEVLEKEESRMFSASILFVCEGDGEAIDLALKEDPDLEHRIEEDEEEFDEEDDEDEEEEKVRPKLVAAKLIDFAHASWVPGQGPDENALKGVRNLCKVLEQLLSQL